MKTAGLVFMMFVSAVSMYGASYAAPAESAPQQSSESSTKAVSSDRATNATPGDGGTHGGKPSDEQRGNRRAADKYHPPIRASLAKANRPNQLSKSRERSTSGNPMNLRQPGSDKSRDVAKGGLVQNETLRSELPVRPSGVIRPTVPSLDNVHHRSPNPAVVGGLANSKTGNTGAINGTRMNRKP